MVNTQGDVNRSRAGISAALTFVIAVAFALLGFVLTSPAEANWSPAATLSAAQGEGKYPSVAMAPDGSTTVAWQALDTSEIMVSTRPAGTGSSFSTPVSISAPASYAPSPLGGDAGGPEVAIDSTGRTTIVWIQAPPPQIDGGLTVWAATRPAGPNTTFSAPVALSDSGFSQRLYFNSSSPEIAIDPTGRTTVVWDFFGANQRLEVQASTRPANSDLFGPPVDVSQIGAADRSDSRPRLAVGPDGRTTVAWESYDYVSGVTSLRASTRPAGSDTFPAPEKLSSSEGDVEGATVAVGPDGKTTVVWSGTFCNPSTGQCRDIIESRTRPGGSNTFAAPVSLSPTGTQNNLYARYPEIAVGPNGQTTVVWEEGIGAEIYSSTRPAGSDTFGTEENISTTTDRSAFPQIAVGPDDIITIAWLDYLTNTDVNGYSVLAATRPKGASTFQTPVFLQQAGTSDAPDVAAGPCNGFTVVWQNEPSYPFSLIQESMRDGVYSSGNCLIPRPRFSFRFLGPELAKLLKSVGLRFRITNTGGATARELRVKVVLAGQVTHFRSAGSLGPEKSKTVEVPVKFKKKGNIPFTATISAANADSVTIKKSVRVVGQVTHFRSQR